MRSTAAASGALTEPAGELERRGDAENRELIAQLMRELLVRR